MTLPHKFDPANAARLNDPARRELMPVEPLARALDLRPGQRVADIGCGTGYWLFGLMEGAPDGVRWHALDSEPAMLEHLRERLQGHARAADVATAPSDEHRLPLADASVDVAVLGAVYHELHDRVGFLAELRRVLAPGGRLAIVDWDALPPGVERTVGAPLAERVPLAVARAEIASAGFDEPVALDGYRECYALVARRPA